MNKRMKIAACFSISLLASALVVESISYDNLKKQSNTMHDSYLKLDAQHTELLKQYKSLSVKQEQFLSSITKVQQQNQVLQKKSEGLASQNRSLQQKVEKLTQVQGNQVPSAQHQQKSNSLTSRSASRGNWESFRATYYDAGVESTGKGPGSSDYGVTASGRTVEAGVTIAVDPSVIKLGSWVEVMYPDGRVEKRRADDTGGMINGHHIDVYVPNCTPEYGVDQVKVRVLE